jgi:8-oxo-dGTP pyrophosphatase MutT (NUDIX family)
MTRITTQGEKQQTASAIILTKELPRKILLVYHKKYNVWIQPGGHVERSENPVEAVVREVKEETGINISFLLKKINKGKGVNFLPLPVFYLEEEIPAYFDQPPHFHLDMHYIVEVPMQKIKSQELESHLIGWFSLEEALKLDAFKDTKVMLKKVLHTE